MWWVLPLNLRRIYEVKAENSYAIKNGCNDDDTINAVVTKFKQCDLRYDRANAKDSVGNGWSAKLVCRAIKVKKAKNKADKYDRH